MFWGKEKMFKVFVVDDECLVIEGIRLLMEDVNVECEIVGSAYDGISAWNQIQQVKPDVLITDIKIPGIDGLDLIRKCKKYFPQILAIVISGFQEFVLAQKAIELGVIGYVDKPITGQKLEDVLRKAETIHFKNMLEESHRRNFAGKVDQLTEELLDENYETVLEMVEQLKKEFLSEQPAIEEYRWNMFMICTSVVGCYYDNTNASIPEKHFPSYKNLSFLTTYEAVDQYVDAVISNIIGKMKAEHEGVTHGSIKNLIMYIEEHYNEDISLNQLADMLKMSPVYLSSLFKEETGISYVRYLTDIRIARAKELLSQGHLVREVCEMVGYPNYRYFCDLFKKHTGVTPTEYKGTVRKNR